VGGCIEVKIKNDVGCGSLAPSEDTGEVLIGMGLCATAGMSFLAAVLLLVTRAVG
jgi:hypothetical protein